MTSRNGRLSLLLVLALLCVADGALTYHNVTLGGTELNPILAALFAYDLNIGSAVRLVVAGVMVWLLWKAYEAETHPRLTTAITGVIIGVEAFCVMINGLQLLLWMGGL